MHFPSLEELLHALLEEKQRIMITDETLRDSASHFFRKAYLLFELCQNISKI